MRLIVLRLQYVRVRSTYIQFLMYKQKYKRTQRKQVLLPTLDIVSSLTLVFILQREVEEYKWKCKHREYAHKTVLAGRLFMSPHLVFFSQLCFIQHSQL